MRNYSLHFRFLACVLMVSGIDVAKAATATATDTNTASVSATCQAPTATALAFGNYNPLLNTEVGSTTTINIKCTNTTPITSVALDAGTNGGAVNARTMELAGDSTKKLYYGLYKDLAHTQMWGDGTNSTTMYTGAQGAGLNTNVSFVVYGVIYANAQNLAAKPGAYTDTITVTVTY